MGNEIAEPGIGERWHMRWPVGNACRPRSFTRKTAVPLTTQLQTFLTTPIVAFRQADKASMHRENAHFERVGIAYMPRTVAGWGYLFAFVIATLALVFIAGAVWAFAGWQGADVIQGAILVAGVLAMVRFAHKKSK